MGLSVKKKLVQEKKFFDIKNSFARGEKKNAIRKNFCGRKKIIIICCLSALICIKICPHFLPSDVKILSR
jgi:hypothetical protein